MQSQRNLDLDQPRIIQYGDSGAGKSDLKVESWLF